MAQQRNQDDDVVGEVRKIGALRTQHEAVQQALVEFRRRQNQLKLLDLFGTIDYEDGFDFKTQRHARRQAPRS